MLTMKLRHVTRAEVERTVEKLCSQYGTVKQVVIVPGGRLRYLIAGVEMSSLSETRKILERFGDTRMGEMAVITIEGATADADDGLLAAP